jgi:hypothetical protein
MTELVLGKGLQVPPQKEAAIRLVQICDTSETSKIQRTALGKAKTVLVSNGELQEIMTASPTTEHINIAKESQIVTNSNLLPLECGKDSQGFSVPVQLMQTKTCETASFQAESNNIGSKEQKSGKQDSNKRKPNLAKSMWISPSTAMALTAASTWKSQVVEKTIEETQAAVVEPEEESVIEDEIEETELNTDTVVGKTVALLLGKPVSKHKNIFDLMADTASKMIKRTFGKKNVPAETQVQVEEMPQIVLMAAEPEPVLLVNDAPEIADAPMIEEPALPYESPAPEVVETKETKKKVACTPVFPASTFKREHRAPVPPPALHNHAIKEAFKLKVMKMGAGRFTFDDIEAKHQDQLIEDLRLAGDRTDVKELHKESELKLRELLKDRQANMTHEMRPRIDGGAPFWRVEQMLNRRAPEARSPSPETVKKWRAAAKKAGVPLEALTKEPLMNPWTSGNQFVSFPNVATQETRCVFVESANADSETNIVMSKADEIRVRPSVATFPRIVNPKHMEMLLNQSPTRPEMPPAITVTVPLPSRLAKGEILWRKLCPLK